MPHLGQYAAALCVLIALGTAQPAEAVQWNLTVTYTGGVVNQGPLSMGLAELPASVTATFVLDGPANLPTFGLGSVISASLPFGDGTFDQGDLHDLTVIPEFGDSGEIIDFATVSYRLGGADDEHMQPWLETIGFDAAADPCVSRFPTTFCRLARNSNFELNVFALDAATEEFAHYKYFTSSQQLTQAPEPSTAALALLGLLGLLSRRIRMAGTCFCFMASRLDDGDWTKLSKGKC